MRCEQNKDAVDKQSSLHTSTPKILRVSASKLADAEHLASSFRRHSGGWKKTKPETKLVGTVYCSALSWVYFPTQ